MALLAISTVLQLSCPQFPTGVKHKKHLRVPSSSTEQVRRESEQQLQEELKQLVNNCLCYRSQYWVYHLHPYAKLHKAFKHLNKSVISFYTLSALTVTLLTMNPLIPSRLEVYSRSHSRSCQEPFCLTKFQLDLMEKIVITFHCNTVEKKLH